MKINRRDFIKVLAAAPATIAGVPAKADDGQAESACDEALGVLVDTSVCIGCRKCEWACNQEHKLAQKPLSNFEDRSVFEQHRRPDSKSYTVVNQFGDPKKPDTVYTMKVQCMHCVKPACVSACIVGALHKDRRGPVVYDAWKCIGCRYCMIACPFQIPAYEYDNPVDPHVRKCTFCFERIINEDHVPACVAICPNEALTFGTRKELIAAARTRIAANPERYVKHVYGEHEVGGTSWLYLAPIGFENTEFPRLGNDPVPETTETIQHGIFKSFVPPLALYGLLGLIMHAMRSNGKENGEVKEAGHE
jgi:Fe-S-cluster-containing dehydrogenase component